MKRIQLYIEEDVWKALELRSRQTGLSILELVRQAVRERYVGDREKRKQALLGIVGMWRDRNDLPDTETYVRQLRRDSRWSRLRQ